jgi:hypothetical protein
MDFKDRSSQPARKAALGGILTGVILCLLFAASVLPTGRLALLALSSMVLSMAVVEYGCFYGFLLYMASGLLGLAILPDKLVCAPFIAFFGYYGILKALIERLRRLWLEWLLKIAAFNVVVVIAWHMASQFLGLCAGRLPNALWLALIVLNIIFAVYDYAFSLVAGFYEHRLRARIWR